MLIKEEYIKYQTLVDIKKEFVGKWVLLKNLRVDTTNSLIGGEVIIFSTNKREVIEQIQNNRNTALLYFKTEKELENSHIIGGISIEQI